MDTRKIKYENKKMVDGIIKHNKEQGEKNAAKIGDESEIVMKDTLSYLGKKKYDSVAAAEKDAEKVVEYYNPNWAQKQSTPKTSGKSFMFSFRTPEEEEKEEKENLERKEKFDKMTQVEKNRYMFPFIRI